MELTEEILILFGIFGLLLSPVYVMQGYLIRRLNYTCGVVGKIKTFLKLVHPDQAKALD